jgi:hypothetical protein
MIFISLYIDYIIGIKDFGLDSQCTRRILAKVGTVLFWRFGLDRHSTVLMEMTGMTRYYRKWPEMTANDRTWKYMTGHEHMWPDMTGNGRKWPDMNGYDQAWPTMTGNDQKWSEMTVWYFMHGPRRYRLTGRYFMHGPRWYKTTREKSFFVFDFFKKTKKWNSFQAKIRCSCTLH